MAAYLVNPDDWLRIMGCESNGNPESHNLNPNTGDDSVGLFMINLAGGNLPGRLQHLRALGYDVWDRESAVAVLKQPEANIRMANLLSAGGHQTGQWSCR